MTVNRNMKVHLFVLFIGIVSAHDRYLGKCPKFIPMEDFNWDKFSGRWYAVEKFDTDSRCLTYDFNENEYGVREVVQLSELNELKKLSINNKVRYRGGLTFPRSNMESDMIVKFPLSVLGSASYKVLDTDYETYALLCTCQSQKILLDIFTFHRRSCTILQRDPSRDASIAQRMHSVLNQQIGEDDPLPDHDFDVINHSNCNYKDDGKGLNIDVDKIIESTKDEVDSDYIEYYDGDWVPEESSDLLREGLIQDSVQATVFEVEDTLKSVRDVIKSSGNGEVKEREREEVTFNPYKVQVPLV